MNRLSVRNLAKFMCASGLCVLLVACGKESPEAMVKSAQDYLAKGDAGAAVIQLRNALQKTPDNAEARFLLGSALVDRRDPAGAIKELRKSLELGYPAEKVVPVLARALTDSGDAKGLVTEFGKTVLRDPEAQAQLKATIGNALVSLGNTKAAETAFAAALAAKPYYADALLGIATLRAASGNLEETTKIVDQVLAQPNPPAEATLFKARLLLAAGKLDEGTALLQKLAAAKPDNLQARYLLTSLALDKGDLEQAAAQVAAIRKVSKQDLRAYYFEALIASRKDDLPAARAAVLQVLKGSPEHVPSLLLAGEIEYRSKQYNQAEDYLRRALKGVPGSLYAQRLLAANYLRMGSPGRALEVLQPALSRGAQDPNLMTVAGEAYLAVGDYPKAAQYFAQVSTLDPKNAAVRTRLGQARMAEGDTDGAIRDLEAASSMDPNVSPADLALVANLLRQKQFDESLAAVERLESKQPNSPLVYNLKGIVYLTKRDFVKARSNFDRALQIQPDYLPAIGNLAQLDRVENKSEAARKRYDALLEKDPKNEQALLGLVNLLQSTGGDPKEIESLLKRAVVASPQSANVRLAIVNFYMRKADGKQALLAAQEANAAMPDDVRMLDLLGQVQLATGDASLAVGTFSKLVSAQPGMADPLAHLAAALATAKEYDKAIARLREALAINPGLFEANRQIAIIYALTGRTDEALKEIKGYQRAHPDDVRGYSMEGDFYGGQQKWREAEAAFRVAQKRAPDDGLIMVKLYTTMANGGKPTAADLAADKWMQDHPKDAVLPTYLGERALGRHDYKAAARYYQALVAQQPDNVMYLNNLAWSAGELGDPKAVSYAEKAVALSPANANVLDTLGTILVKKGDVTQGLETLQKASRLAPNQGDIRLHLAKAHIKAGDKVAARKELEALAQASGQAAGKSPTGAKGAAADPKSAQASADKAPATSLVCSPDCAAEAAELLKTL